MGSLIREYRVFPSGNTFKSTETVNNIADGTSVTLFDAGPFYETPPPNSNYDYCVHTLLFWNVGGAISSGSSANVTIQGTTVVTGWYQYSCSPGGNGPSITTYAFDADANANMAGTTPIGSVTPSGLWTPGSNSVTPPTSGDVTIDAKNSIGASKFVRWLVFGAGTLSSDDVVIPANSGGFYVAIYEQKKARFEFERFFEELVKGGLEIDWVVDPSPIDRFRLALIAAQVASGGGSPGANPTQLDAADARKELTRLKAEIKGLKAREKALEKRIDGSSKSK